MWGWNDDRWSPGPPGQGTSSQTQWQAALPCWLRRVALFQGLMLHLVALEWIPLAVERDAGSSGFMLWVCAVSCAQQWVYSVVDWRAAFRVGALQSEERGFYCRDGFHSLGSSVWVWFLFSFSWPWLVLPFFFCSFIPKSFKNLKCLWIWAT